MVSSTPHPHYGPHSYGYHGGYAGVPASHHHHPHGTPALQYSQFTPYNQIYNYLPAGTGHGYVKTAAPHYTYAVTVGAPRNHGVGAQSV